MARLVIVAGELLAPNLFERPPWRIRAGFTDYRFVLGAGGSYTLAQLLFWPVSPPPVGRPGSRRDHA
jgi:hypothetical protein